MSGDTRSYTLEVSEYLFMLTTESLRRHSNATQRYQTLASLVNERAASGVPLEQYDTETLRQHLETIPTKGPIRIHLSISRSSADTLIDAKRKLAKQLGASLTVGDALSVLLLDFMAEHHAKRILGKIVDEASDTRDEASPSITSGTNAASFK
jgi:hypothetical protein